MDPTVTPSSMNTAYHLTFSSFSITTCMCSWYKVII